MPSNHLILCRPLLLLPPIPPSIRVFSNESVLHIRWPKYWSFSFNISPSNERTPRTDLLSDGLVGSPCSPRDSQESSPTPQFKSIPIVTDDLFIRHMSTLRSNCVQVLPWVRSAEHQAHQLGLWGPWSGSRSQTANLPPLPGLLGWLFTLYTEPSI